MDGYFPAYQNHRKEKINSHHLYLTKKEQTKQELSVIVQINDQENHESSTANARHGSTAIANETYDKLFLAAP